MRTLDAVLNQIRRIMIAMGYIPNHEWLRAQLNRQVAVDRAKAHLAIVELGRLVNDAREDATKRANSPGAGR